MSQLPRTPIDDKIEEYRSRVRNHLQEREENWSFYRALRVLGFNSRFTSLWATRYEYHSKQAVLCRAELTRFEEMKIDCDVDIALAKELIELENKKHASYYAVNHSAPLLAASSSDRAKAYYQRSKCKARALSPLVQLQDPSPDTATTIVASRIESLIYTADQYWHEWRQGNKHSKQAVQKYLSAEAELYKLGFALETSKYGAKYEYKRTGRCSAELNEAIKQVRRERRHDELDYTI